MTSVAELESQMASRRWYKKRAGSCSFTRLVWGDSRQTDGSHGGETEVNQSGFGQESPGERGNVGMGQRVNDGHQY